MVESEQTKSVKPEFRMDALLSSFGAVALLAGLVFGFTRQGSDGVCGSVLGGGMGGGGYTSVDTGSCQIRLLPAQQWTELLIVGAFMALIAGAVLFSLKRHNR
ncbi:hypothetical protein [Amycolatopsis sp. cmx-11-51]|uniref:hypothetical protein n=1 Tax=Amycolatopsis sp. cmx-11-51 TaxID=2785797 RepID=UPI0039E46013